MTGRRGRSGPTGPDAGGSSEGGVDPDVALFAQWMREEDRRERDARRQAKEARRLEEAARQLDALAAHANASEVRIAQAMHSLRGRLAAARGDDDGALAAFERAIAAADVDDDRLERAGLYRAFGRFLRAIGRRRESVEQLAEARRLAAGMGASWLVLMLDDDLGAASALSSPGSSSGPAAKLGGLTERERDVVMLVVEGRTNKEVAVAMYVSTKAVEYHLGNVYAKLAISSRRELRHLVDAT